MSEPNPHPSPPSPSVPLDTGNLFLVGQNVGSQNVSICNYLPKVLTRDQALNLAAWLLVIAGDPRAEFDRLVDDIKNS